MGGVCYNDIVMRGGVKGVRWDVRRRHGGEGGVRGRYAGSGGSLETLKKHIIKKDIFPLFWGGANEGGEGSYGWVRGEWGGAMAVRGGGEGGSATDTFWKRVYNIEKYMTISTPHTKKSTVHGTWRILAQFKTSNEKKYNLLCPDKKKYETTTSDTERCVGGLKAGSTIKYCTIHASYKRHFLAWR